MVSTLAGAMVLAAAGCGSTNSDSDTQKTENVENEENSQNCKTGKVRKINSKHYDENMMLHMRNLRW